MKDSPPNLSELRPAAEQSTRLKQYCDSGQLFRDRYRVMRLLGRGGFGVTYLAQDTLLPVSPLCVIKQLSPKMKNPMSLERARIRFKREAKILSKLGSHSQIPMLLDYFTVKGEFYLVQEYIQGETISKEVRRSGPQNEIKVKQFLQEILPVIKYVHRHRVIHRDIKPPNIIRCRNDGRLVLIDFGAVREYLANQADDPLQKNPTTQFVGTMGFAPPEQLALRPTYASDIYALGVTCLFMLTGRSPVEFESDPETGEILWRSYVQVSSHFAAVLNKMLKFSTEERYQKIDEVKRTLDLEPYFNSLADCMNTPSGVERSSPPEDIVIPMNGYLTPIQREAAAIRKWRSRRLLKEQGRRRRGILTTSKAFPL